MWKLSSRRALGPDNGDFSGEVGAGTAVRGAALVGGRPVLPFAATYCARQDFAEHFFRSNALHCTATARMLIPAECSAIS